MKDLSKDYINLLRYHARNVVRELGLLNDAYFDIGVTLAERHLLIELSSCLYPTVGEIAERLLLDKSTVSRLISKAVKKGFIKCSFDDNDKRKRFLQLTEKGKKVLNTFEPIAFNQTKEALLTLTPEEIEMVYQGIALYAKGLKSSRLRHNMTISQLKPQDNAGLAHLITECNKKDEWNDLLKTYRQKDFFYFVMKMESKIIGGAGISPLQTGKIPTCEIGKICIQPDRRHLGFEKLLIDFCLKKAKKFGYGKAYVDPAKETLFSKEFFQIQGFQFTKHHKYNGSLLWKAC